MAKAAASRLESVITKIRDMESAEKTTAQRAQVKKAAAKGKAKSIKPGSKSHLLVSLNGIVTGRLFPSWDRHGWLE